MRAFAVWTTVAFYVITKSLERMNYKFSKEIDVIMFKDYKKERGKGAVEKKKLLKKNRNLKIQGVKKNKFILLFHKSDQVLVYLGKTYYYAKILVENERET